MGKKIITHSNGVVETRETFYTEKTIQQLKQQLAEKDKEIKKLNWQLKDKDFTIKNLNHSLSVAPNANAGQRARIDELTKIVKEKDKEIETLKQELEELKERYIIPKFQLGQTIFTPNKPNDCIYELKIVSIHTERSEFCDRKFNSLVYLAERIKDSYIGGYSEEDLFATEQEAIEKLKEMKGNE